MASLAFSAIQDKKDVEAPHLMMEPKRNIFRQKTFTSIQSIVKYIFRQKTRAGEICIKSRAEKHVNPSN